MFAYFWWLAWKQFSIAHFSQSTIVSFPIKETAHWWNDFLKSFHNGPLVSQLIPPLPLDNSMGCLKNVPFETAAAIL